MINAEQRRLLILIGSPRRNGNSNALAQALAQGARLAGTVVDVRFVDDHIASFLRDCRTCRGGDGECSIEDGFRSLFFDGFLPADGIVFCSPLYWYGVSAQIKAFFDRMFCYYATSYPGHDAVIRGMSGKRVGLLIASEETYPGAVLGVVHQVQEFARYTHSEFAGIVRGIGNTRGEILSDPANPLLQAELLGQSFFSAKCTDYRLDTQRGGRVWPV